jgi:hypothetical protein
MNTDKMLEGHVKATLDRCKSSSEDVLVVSQDTVIYNFTTHTALEGVGTLQGKLKGTLQHNVLACDGQGLPLGLLYQLNWTRGGLNDLENESQKWHLGLQAVSKLLGNTAKKVVLVQDREADIFEFFRAQRAPNVDLVVRVHQPRKLEVAALGQVLPLPQAAGQLPLLAELSVAIERNNHSVQLTLQVSAGAVAALPGKDLSTQKHKVEDLYLVVAREVAARDAKGNDVFDEQQAAQWLLLTSYPVKQASDAFQVVRFYALRWRIERLHFVLKSGGLQVERLQFDDIATLFNAFAFYCIIAWRVLFLTYLARQNEPLPAQDYFDPLELQLLQASNQKASSKPADNKPVTTLSQAVVALGRLVNFQPTTKQPLPGVKLLAQALVKLHHMREAILIWQNLSLQD